MERLRHTDIKYLKGVGPQRAELLAKELGIHTCADLLRHYPSHYVDRSSTYRIADFAGDMPTVQVRGRFISFTIQGEGAKKRLTGLFSDGTRAMEVVWFRKVQQILKVYQTGVDYVVFGKPSLFGNRWSMVHPEIDPAGSSVAAQGLRGVYPLTEKLRSSGFTSRTLHTFITSLLSGLARNIAEPLPQSVTRPLRLISLQEALTATHSPANNAQLQ